MNSEYANQAAYDAISIHGGSGFIMEYEAQRLYRDSRIFSIYEGTTQLQVVAAIRYVTNGTYLKMIEEMLQHEVAEDLKPLQERVKEMTAIYKQAVEYVKDADNQEMHDFLAYRLCDMTGNILVSLLLLDDATRNEDLFARSAKVFIFAAREKVVGHADYIQNFIAEDLKDFRVETEDSEEPKK
jgi:alkylation response protein AidB-like acyl-CoA dehydrogenase